MKKITPFLWFDGKAEEAAKFYVSLFKGSKVTNVTRAGPKGPVMSVAFNLAGQDFIALNGGPHFQFTPAFSMFVDCKSQAEVDRLWSKLTKNGGEESMCGWLKDKFGLSWQIIPSILGKLLGDKDPQKAQRAMQAMLKMRKLDVKALQAAAAQK